MADQHLHPLSVVGLQQRDERESPVLLLEDELGRRLEITIGICEALAIQRSLEGQRAVRPLTHDLLLTLADRLAAPISRIIIDDFSGGTYYARLILNNDGTPTSLDCRPSDGIALALRANVPILANDLVMEGGNSES